MLPRLYVPRRTIALRPVSGQVRILDNTDNDNLPSILLFPHIIDDYGTEAIESGRRSALIGTEEMYLIKGCKPSNRCHPEMPHLPLGSQIFSTAQREVEKTLELSEIFAQEGFRMPRIPVGYFIYQGRFNEEPLTATLFRTQGDTRLQELMRYFLNYFKHYRFFDERPRIREVYNLFDKLSFLAGRLKGITDRHHYTWGTEYRNSTIVSNAHCGNYVLFGENGSISLGIVDLDGCKKWDVSEENEMKSVQKFEHRIEGDLRSWGFEGFENGYNGTNSLVTISHEELKLAEEIMLEAKRKYLCYNRYPPEVYVGISPSGKVSFI